MLALISIWLDIAINMAKDEKPSKPLIKNDRQKLVSLLIKNLQLFKRLVEKIWKK